MSEEPYLHPDGTLRSRDDLGPTTEHDGARWRRVRLTQDVWTRTNGYQAITLPQVWQWVYERESEGK